MSDGASRPPSGCAPPSGAMGTAPGSSSRTRRPLTAVGQKTSVSMSSRREAPRTSSLVASSGMSATFGVRRTPPTTTVAPRTGGGFPRRGRASSWSGRRRFDRSRRARRARFNRPNGLDPRRLLGADPSECPLWGRRDQSRDSSCLFSWGASGRGHRSAPDTDAERARPFPPRRSGPQARVPACGWGGARPALKGASDAGALVRAHVLGEPSPGGNSWAGGVARRAVRSALRGSALHVHTGCGAVSGHPVPLGLGSLVQLPRDPARVARIVRNCDRAGVGWSLDGLGVVRFGLGRTRRLGGPRPCRVVAADSQHAFVVSSRVPFPAEFPKGPMPFSEQWWRQVGAHVARARPACVASVPRQPATSPELLRAMSEPRPAPMASAAKRGFDAASRAAVRRLRAGPWWQSATT